MTACHIHRHILLDDHVAGGLGSLVGGQAHEVHLAGHGDMPDHIRIKYHNTLQNTQHHRVLAFILPGDFLTHLFDSCLDLFLGNKNFQNIIFHFSLSSV